MMPKLNIYKQHKNNYVDKTYCRGCEAEEDMHRPIDEHWWARRDAYGIFTGIYCDDCYNSNDGDRYPYKKGSYAQELEHGEDIWPEEERY